MLKETCSVRHLIIEGRNAIAEQRTLANSGREESYDGRGVKVFPKVCRRRRCHGLAYSKHPLPY